MKQSTHSQAPISPVSRKLRSDSKLSALSPGAQSLLLQKLETQSYQETASWLQDSHGISVSPSNLSTYRSRHLENQALKEAYLQSATCNATLYDLQQQEIDPGDAQVEAAVRRLFLFKVVNQGDIGTYLQFTRVGNESKKLVLTQAREERLRQERQEAQDNMEEGDGENLDSADPASSKLVMPFAPLSALAAQRSEAPVPPLSPSPFPPVKPTSSDLAPCPDKASDPADLPEAFQRALDGVMPLDPEAEPVSPSSLDPLCCTMISTVIGRMLDLIQSGNFSPAARSSTSQPAPAPERDQPWVASPPSPESATDMNPVPPISLPVPEEEDASSQSASGQSTSPLSCNSLKYPKTPSIRSTPFFLPDHPAPSLDT